MDARGIYLPTQKNNTKRHIEAPPSPSHWAPNIDPGFATVSASKLTQILQGDVEGFWAQPQLKKDLILSNSSELQWPSENGNGT